MRKHKAKDIRFLTKSKLKENEKIMSVDYYSVRVCLHAFAWGGGLVVRGGHYLRNITTLSNARFF